MTVQSIIELAPSTKEQVTAFANQLITDVEEGTTNPLKLYSQIIILEKALTQVKDAIKELVLNEALKHSQKTFDFNGCKIEVRELGVKYDYTNCNDEAWGLFKEREEANKSLRVEREMFLKGVKDHETIVNEFTGEVITVYPPQKTSTTGVTVTLK